MRKYALLSKNVFWLRSEHMHAQTALPLDVVNPINFTGELYNLIVENTYHLLHFFLHIFDPTDESG